MAVKRYRIKECFYSLQGEGVRAGTANVFLRFSGCNLTCTKATHGFDCDTDFTGGNNLTASQIVQQVVRHDQGKCRWIVLTGGEPALQLDDALIARLKQARYRLAIETNGTRTLPEGIDWICVSPKVPEPQIAVHRAQEVKYVIRAGQPLPSTVVHADHHLLSPAFEAAPSGLDASASPRFPPVESLRWCIELCRANPPWRLSMQQHKLWRLR